MRGTKESSMDPFCPMHPCAPMHHLQALTDPLTAAFLGYGKCHVARRAFHLVPRNSDTRLQHAPSAPNTVQGAGPYYIPNHLLFNPETPFMRCERERMQLCSPLLPLPLLLCCSQAQRALMSHLCLHVAAEGAAGGVDDPRGGACLW